jgi:LacI family transcriptional regulator
VHADQSPAAVDQAESPALTRRRGPAPGQAGDAHVTIHDIAARAQVSVATVSRVVNGTAFVRPATQQRVLAAIRDLDFHPDSIARSLSTRRTDSVALITSDIANPTYPVIARVLADVLQAQGYTLALYNTDDDPVKIEQIVAALRRRRVDGAVIVQHLPVGNEAFRVLARHGVPLVSLGPETADVPGIDVVQGNVEEGTYAAASHLIGLGHRRIAYVGAPPAGATVTTGYDQALRGLRRALADHGAPDDPTLVVAGDTRLGAGSTAIDALMAIDAPPTAILASNDVVALGVVAEATRLGLSIPRDLSVVGCDGIPLLELFQPRLATVAQPLAEMAERAGQILLQRMAGATETPPEWVFLPCKAIMEGSVGPPPAESEARP